VVLTVTWETLAVVAACTFSENWADSFALLVPGCPPWGIQPLSKYPPGRPCSERAVMSMSKVRAIVITLAVAAGVIAATADPAAARMVANHCPPPR
jgi:hypothetical protein